MNMHFEVYNALKTASEASPKSLVFRTYNRDIFLEACKAAHLQKQNDEPLLFLTCDKTGKSQMFNFTSFVLQMKKPEKQKIRSILQNAWSAAKYPNGMAQNVELESQAEQVPLNKGIFQGLNIEQIEFIGKRLASIDKDLRAIAGQELVTTLDFYANFERVGVSNHEPSHNHAVMNETWLQNGTVIIDEDGRCAYQVSEGDRLFMPRRTLHRPPEASRGEVSFDDPRISMISNACSYG